MAQRRSPHRLSAVPANNNLARRNYSLRQSSAAKRALAFVNRIQRSTSNSHALSASPPSSSDTLSLRPILATLQPNLRKLPSRQYLLQKDSMRNVGQHIDVAVGSKRKRVVSLNENAHAGGRSTRGPGKPKRRKAIGSQPMSSDESDDTSSMDVDSSVRWNASDESDPENDGEESSDEFLINEASPRQLLRLRKDELVRLYFATGLADDADSFTKPELVQAIVAARDDIASLPPSSPPGRGDGNSSDFSSDDGNIAGDEETDISNRHATQFNGLRRRATVHIIKPTNDRVLKTRSFSLGQLNSHACQDDLGAASKTKNDRRPRRRTTRSISSRSSPTPSSTYQLPSPPATRLRSRKASTERTISSSSSTKGKGKGKQVEFSDDVQVRSPGAPAQASGDESELTDLAELEEKIAFATPSPRRLRSRDKCSDKDVQMGVEDTDPTPRRGVKSKAVLQEDTVDDENDEDASRDDEEEVDELISSPSPTPSSSRARTPVKRRLRPRRLQTHTPPTDGGEGDDEDEEELAEIEDDGEEEDIEEEDGPREEDEGDVYEGGASDPPLTTPRKLRNGKVVGEEEIHEEIQEEVQEEAAEENSDEEGGDEDDDIDLAETEDIDAEGENDDEDVDLTIATAKTLVRLRRDDLVRLCESRDLDIAGTKPQLAQSLLQWRDQHANGFSSPSSTGTVRPSSTARGRTNGRRTKTRSQSSTPPVLRYQHSNRNEPRSPPPSNPSNNQPEPELELHLGSLGLEDREIPPDKLTKLEKIGSGGFKDVFIGKFKGRKIAIAEFRDQLSSMDIKELKLLGGFDHPNIVRFLGVSIPENTRETPVMIVSELCSNGDLFDYVRNVPAPSLHKVLNIMLDIARGLEYLHMHKPSVIHRDCKSSNILITSKGTAKIADFGLAKVKQSTRSMVRSLVGTVNWQAPELWHAHPKYNHKVDVFSCAMVYWEMLQWHNPNKKFPWEGMNEHAIYEIVGAKRQRPSISGLRKQWCPEIVDLLERMWAQDAQDRPTMSEVVESLEHIIAR
ncbi:hypothetical protein BJ138DRAFT_1126675 [Hygrophoropsis aurantiaca]|uniref:Uncharacterized protein n=1 Tax=Hygrophoropsis aurantiaca TaxID=72124 RepID=A0ACB8ABY5_9AGAM|nr:hypothetical protein BJ138DRAFT_1126675 [Hygrophoropsis aurantiaca]